MDGFAEKRSVFGCSSVPVCPGTLCAGMGESRRGRRGGTGLGTAAERAARLPRRKRVGGDGNLGALGGMAQLALFCPARPGPWHSLLLCSSFLNVFLILLVAFLCFLVSQTFFQRGRESGASERDHQWGKQRLILKIFSCLPLSCSQRSSNALPMSMQGLAWDGGTRRMLSDLKVLSCKAVCGNVCVSACGGPKCRTILLVLQGKAHQHTEPSLELCANS